MPAPCPAVCLLAALPLVPESPHTLMALGRHHEARRVLLAAAALNGTLPALQRQLRQQEEEQQQQQQEREHHHQEQQRPPGGQGDGHVGRQLHLHGASSFRSREACPARLPDGPGCAGGSGCAAAVPVPEVQQQEPQRQARGRECSLDGQEARGRGRGRSRDGPDSPSRGARHCAVQGARHSTGGTSSRHEVGGGGGGDGGDGGTWQMWSKDPPTHPAPGSRPSSGSGRAPGASSSRLGGSTGDARPPPDLPGGATRSAGASAPATPRTYTTVSATPDARAAAALGRGPPSPPYRAQSFSVDSSPSSPVGAAGGGGAGWSMRVSASGSGGTGLGSPGGSSRGWRVALLGEGGGSGSGSGGGGSGGGVDSGGLSVVASGRAGRWGCCRRLYGLWSELLGPELRGTTLRLGVLWFVCALVYYGVVLVLPSVSGGLRHVGQDGSGGADGKGASAAAAGPGPDGDPNGVRASGNTLGWACHGSRVVLPYSVYGGMVAASAAELPSLALAAAVVDRWSKRRALAWGMGAAAAALAPVAVAGGHGGGTVGGVDVGPGGMSLPSWLPFASVTLARLFVSGGFVLLYVLTPERFPARVRGSALGACNSLARVGALVAPFVAVALPQRGGGGGGGVAAALGLLAALSGAATLAAGGLRD